MPKAAGPDQTAPSRNWRAFGLTPLLEEAWNLGTDPAPVGLDADLIAVTTPTSLAQASIIPSAVTLRGVARGGQALTAARAVRRAVHAAAGRQLGLTCDFRR